MYIKATSFVNFALVKYWGKKDKETVTPFNDSISVTWDVFKTYTILESSSSFSFTLNNQRGSTKETNKVKMFLEHFTDNVEQVRVISQNTFPTAAGLASSASAFSALAKAANHFFQCHYDDATLQAITRKGSGSAVRSLYGGAVRWNRDGSVTPIKANINNFRLIVVMVDERRKSIASRDAMERTVQTSPYFKQWVETANNDADTVEKALKNEDFTTLGQTVSQNAMAMHASMLAATPPVLYIKDATMHVLNIVDSLKEQGIECFYTLDAGSNVKIITKASSVETISTHLHKGGFTHLYHGKPSNQGAFISDEG